MSKRGLFPQEQDREKKDHDVGFWIVLLAISVIVMGLLMFARPTHAQENFFYKGEIGRSYFPLCDTQEQVENIILAYTEGGFVASHAKYREYYQTPSPDGGSVCLAGNPDLRLEINVIIHERVAKYDLFDEDGEDRTFYIIRVTIPTDEKQADYYLMATWDVTTREQQEKAKWQKI